MIMSIAMVAMLAFGGTFAYFTATATEKTTAPLTTATIQLASDTTATLSFTGDKLLPGDNVTLEASVTNNSNEKIWAFTSYTLAGVPDSDTLTLTMQGTTWKQLDGVDNVYYAKIEAAGDVEYSAVGEYDATSASTGDTIGASMNKEITVTVKFAATQYRNVDDVTTAYDLVKASL